MAGQIETKTSTRKSRNVELNVVPFIDLMTCLTAFLLVTAVWSQTAAVPIERGGHGTGVETDERPPPISVLVTPEALWVGSSALDARRVDSLADLEQQLVRYKQTTYANRTDIEVAAEDSVDYETLISTLDSAIASGFDGVQVVDPPSLTTRFRH